MFAGIFPDFERIFPDFPTWRMMLSRRISDNLGCCLIISVKNHRRSFFDDPCFFCRDLLYCIPEDHGVI